MDRRIGIAVLALLLLSGCGCAMSKEEANDLSNYMSGCLKAIKK